MQKSIKKLLGSSNVISVKVNLILHLKSAVFLSVALEEIAVNSYNSSLSSQSWCSTETRKTKNFNDFASSLITIRIYSAEGLQPVCVETAEKLTKGADPLY